MKDGAAEVGQEDRAFSDTGQKPGRDQSIVERREGDSVVQLEQPRDAVGSDESHRHRGEA